jgi:predicted ABC-type ATPase
VAYELDADELDLRFTRDILAALLADDPQPQPHPRLVIVAGQPGAGKSFTERAVIRDLALDQVVAVDADNLRPHHPRYHELARADDRSADLLTLSASRFWTTQALKFAAANKFNVLWSTALASTEAAHWVTSHFKPFGYRIDLAAIAVDTARSQLSILHRYQRGRDLTGAGRMVTIDYHDMSYTLLPEILEQLESRQTIDGVHIYDREGSILYRNTLRSGRWTTAPAGRATLDDVRARPWTSRQAAAFRSIAGWLSRDPGTDPAADPRLMPEHRCGPLAQDLRPRLEAAVAAGEQRLHRLAVTQTAFPLALNSIRQGNREPARHSVSRRSASRGRDDLQL